MQCVRQEQCFLPENIDGTNKNLPNVFRIDNIAASACKQTRSLCFHTNITQAVNIYTEFTLTTIAAWISPFLFCAEMFEMSEMSACVLSVLQSASAYPSRMICQSCGRDTGTHMLSILQPRALCYPFYQHRSQILCQAIVANIFRFESKILNASRFQQNAIMSTTIEFKMKLKKKI